MRLAYIGNFEPAHSTENHVARAFEHNGHTVHRCQEGKELPVTEADFVLWTRTKSLAFPPEVMYRFLLQMLSKGIPVVGYHLDIWWGLKRETEIADDPFFRVDLLCTADGGHDEKWAEAGVNHRWLPPAVSLAETEPGMWRSDLASPIAFVGSHNGDYHPESAHRHELVRWLKTNFARDCAFWPRPGEHALRGNDLRDLYQSVDVLVGDSCFAGTGLKRYVSDRLPETMGRGGYLLHPRVEGVTDGSTTDSGVPMWQEGEHLGCWNAFDWDALGEQIEWALTHPDERTLISAKGREHTRQWHSYEHRMTELMDLLMDRGLLARPAPSKAATLPSEPESGAISTTKGGTRPATRRPSAPPAGKATNDRPAQ